MLLEIVEDNPKNWDTKYVIKAGETLIDSYEIDEDGDIILMERGLIKWS